MLIVSYGEFRPLNIFPRLWRHPWHKRQLVLMILEKFQRQHRVGIGPNAPRNADTRKGVKDVHHSQKLKNDIARLKTYLTLAQKRLTK